MAGYFIERLQSLGRFQGNFELEWITMVSAFSGQSNSSIALRATIVEPTPPY